MMFILGVVFVSLLCVSAHPTRNELFYEAERECGKDFSRLWLDIVFVVDVSKGMTDDGLGAVHAHITSVFLENQALGIQKNNPYTTRVGLVVYDKTARVAFDLNKVTSYNALEVMVGKALSHVTTSDASYLDIGLAAASDLLYDVQYKAETGVDRDHYRKLIFVYASSYKVSGNHDAQPIAERLKTSGVSISTIAYGQEQSSYLQDLAAIASPTFALTHLTGTFEKLQEIALEANCHCQHNWYQLRNRESHHIGVCLRPVKLVAKWRAAERACIREGGHLVHEYSHNKQDLIHEKLNKTFEKDNDYSYFIGLKFDTDGFYWDPNTSQREHKLGDVNSWSIGYPQGPLAAYPVVVAQQVSTNPRRFEWKNVGSETAAKYVCEKRTCDSTNYCEPEII